MRRRPLGAVGLFIIVVFVAMAAFGPLLAPYDPTQPNLAQRLAPPSPAHPLGTDSVGMDILSRILYGARIDLGAALMVIVISGSIGILVGMASAWAGGWWDEVLMRVTDMFLAFPSLILAMAISAVLS